MPQAKNESTYISTVKHVMFYLVILAFKLALRALPQVSQQRETDVLKVGLS